MLIKKWVKLVIFRVRRKMGDQVEAEVRDEDGDEDDEGDEGDEDGTTT